MDIRDNLSHFGLGHNRGLRSTHYTANHGNMAVGQCSTDCDDASVPVAPVAGQPVDPNCLPQRTQLPGSISPQASKHSSCTTSSCAVRLLKFVAAAAAFLLLFAACMVVHGGAVLADWHLARCYLALRARPTKQAYEQLALAQQSARECAVTLALLFLAPAVSIKWALVMFLGDFSWIPVLSVITSSISYTVVTSCFLASRFIYSRSWALKQRALGIAAVAATVFGQFLWRLGARSFLVLKFGGEAYFLYTATMHVVIGIGIIARPKSSRHAYRDIFARNRIQVFLLTLHGAALASDFITFYKGLKSRRTASRATWLKQLCFSSNSLAMLAWRILEGIVCYIIILIVHAGVPCDKNRAPVEDWWQMCASLVQTWYVWRPRCWGCSMFDRYYLSEDIRERQVIIISMLVPAVLLLLFMVCGLLVLWKLLGGIPPDAAVAGGAAAGVSTDAAAPHRPAEAASRQHHQLDESEYDYEIDASQVRDSQGVDWLVDSSTSSHARSSLGIMSSPARCSLEYVSSVQRGPLPCLWPFVGSVSTLLGVQSSVVSQTQLLSGNSSLLPLAFHGATSTPASVYPCAVPLGAASSSSSSGVLVPSGNFEAAASGALRQASGDCSSCSFSECGLLESHTAGHRSSFSWERPNLADLPSLPLYAGISSAQTAQQPVPAVAAGPASSSAYKCSSLRAWGFVVLVVLCDLIVFNCHWVFSLVMLVIGIFYTVWQHVAFLFQHHGESLSRVPSTNLS